MAGTIGSNRFREAVNEKILGELGLSGCFIRTYPSYKRWDKRKDGGKRKDSYGFLLNEDGMKIPIPRENITEDSIQTSWKTSSQFFQYYELQPN